MAVLFVFVTSAHSAWAFVLHCSGKAPGPVAVRADLDVLTRGVPGGGEPGGYNLVVQVGPTPVRPLSILHHMGETQLLSDDGTHVSVQLTPKFGLTHFGAAQIPDTGSGLARGYGVPGPLAVDLKARRALLLFRVTAADPQVLIPLVCLSP